MNFTVELSLEQAEQVTRDYLIDLLNDIECVPFGDPNMIECLNRLVSYMSVPGEWKDGRHDD